MMAQKMNALQIKYINNDKVNRQKKLINNWAEVQNFIISKEIYSVFKAKSFRLFLLFSGLSCYLFL
jgi:hypothetical protein